MSTLSGVSVVMPTYGRTRVLGEAIQGFLQQTYAGPKELVIFNDRVDQTLVCDIPTVKIINFSTRYSSLGAKRNALISAAKYPFVCTWDDDDIVLPERISRGMSLYQDRQAQGYRISRESHCFQTEDNTTLVLRDAGHLWSCLFDKKTFSDIGGFNDQDMYEDLELLHRMIHKGWLYGESSTPGMPSFIYRRGGTPYTHMMDAGVPEFEEIEAGNKQVQHYIKEDTDKKIAAGAEPVGTIEIKPFWAKDYTAMARDLWQASGRA